MRILVVLAILGGLPWLRRVARPAVWIVVIAGLAVGGVRAAAIDRAAEPVAERAVVEARVVFTEPLAGVSPSGREPGPRAGPDGSASPSADRTGSPGAAASGVRAVLDGRAIIVAPPRFGPPAPALPRGAVAMVSGRLVALGDGPGDARLRRQGVAGRLLAKTIAWDGAMRGGALGPVDRLSAAAQRVYAQALGQRRGALVAGMALGADDGIGESDEAALRRAGLAHLVAASGGNVALVVGLVMALGWGLGLPGGLRLALAALAVAAYVPLAGGGPSIQRAGVMGLAALLALAIGRERRGADALALAAAATLAWDPRAVLEPGWQLSFAAAAALIAGAAPLARRLQASGLPRVLALGLACTLLATVATAPVMLLVFGELSLIGVVANLLVLPLVGVCVWSGALAAVLAPLAPVLAGWVAEPAGVAAGLTLAIAEWADARTYAVIGPGAVGVLVLVAALVWLVRPPRWLVAGAAASAVAALVVAVPRPPSEPRLIVFDIGQGSAALLQDGTSGVLVDAGPADGELVSALRRSGVQRLRAIVLSHPAADHDGGAAAVLAALPVDLVLDGGSPGGGATHAAALLEARRRGVPVRPVRAGQRLAFGRVAVRVRWPTPRAAASGGDPNDRAAVVEARVGALRALIPADAEGNMLAAVPLERTDVLVVSHHGSNDPGLPALLRRLRPRAAVISLGAENTYGHPTPSTLHTLRGARVPTLRTDQDGSIDLRASTAGGVTIRRIPKPR